MNIIGQKKLLSTIDNLIENNNFPRYSIIVGNTGSGKKLITSYIAEGLEALLVPCELSVDSVREVIDLSYSQTSPTLYMWADANKMSAGAKNAVLKVTEEPPQNAYFVMTTDNVNGLLNTLTSRGTVFNINPYTVEDLVSYATLKNIDTKSKEFNTIINISTTPQDIINLSTVDIAQFDKVVNVLCKSVGSINLANTLKISTLLKFKDNDDDKEKFDPILFMKACMNTFAEFMKEDNKPIYHKFISKTSEYLADMYSKSLNKVCTVDNWLIDLDMLARKEKSL